MNRENVTHRSGLLAALVGLGGLLLSPGLADAAAPYVVEHGPIEALSYLPIEGGGEVVEPILESVYPTGIFEDAFFGSAGIQVPFPVRFFGQDYSELGVGVHGIVTFGPRSETLCGRDVPATGPACANRDSGATGPIPRHGVFPNRLLAAWWQGANTQSLKYQIVGEAPHRALVIEFIYSTGAEFQVWFREGDSTIEVQYGPDPQRPGGRSHVGLMAPPPDGGLTEGYPGLDCTKNGGYCTWADFPGLTKIRYVVPPDLTVSSVSASGAAIPGVPLTIRAEIANIGDAIAEGATARFYLSPEPRLGPESQELGELSETFDIPIRDSIEVELVAVLPGDLVAGTYYVLVQADPYGAVRGDVNFENNLGASGPLLVGVNTPLLSIENLEIGGELVAGESFTLAWRVENTGSARAQRLPYSIHLSGDEVVTPLDPQLYRGELNIDAFSEASDVVSIALPEHVEAGHYYLGFVLDPTGILPAPFKANDVRISERLLLRGAGLRAITTSLPAAEQGSFYCVNLEAAGGDGVYLWELEAGSSLPPGLALEELPAGAREAGVPFLTRLCGKPSELGSFSFRLGLRSGGESTSQELVLDVVRDQDRLQLVTTSLPAAAYLTPYEGRLRAVGGTPPYRWELIEGRLPLGLSIGQDGTIAGVAAEDGRYPFTLRLSDRAGETVEAEIALLVTSPTHLSCGTRSLPTLELGVELEARLSAAGGTKPYRWQTVETRRLADEIGDLGESLGSAPPPGLALSSSGEISGAPSAAGLYLWTVSVSDSEAMPAEDVCVIAVEVLLDRGLAIATRSLAPAVADAEYAAQLHVSGPRDGLRWSLMAGEVLPDGLGLSADGLISGTPSADQLDGEDRRVFPFLVEVRDAQNRMGRAALSIQLLAAPAVPTETTTTSSGSGCSSAAGAPAALALTSLLAALASRRRRAGDDIEVHSAKG